MKQYFTLDPFRVARALSLSLSQPVESIFFPRRGKRNWKVSTNICRELLKARSAPMGKRSAIDYCRDRWIELARARNVGNAILLFKSPNSRGERCPPPSEIWRQRSVGRYTPAREMDSLAG